MAPSRGTLVLRAIRSVTASRPTSIRVAATFRPSFVTEAVGFRSGRRLAHSASLAVDLEEADDSRGDVVTDGTRPGTLVDNVRTRHRDIALASASDARLDSDTTRQSTFFTSRRLGAAGSLDDVFEDQHDDYKLFSPTTFETSITRAATSLEASASNTLCRMLTESSEEGDSMATITKLLRDCKQAGLQIEPRALFTKGALHAAKIGNGTDCLEWLSVCPLLPSRLAPSGEVSHTSPLELLDVLYLFLSSPACQRPHPNIDEVVQIMQQLIRLGALYHDKSATSPSFHSFAWLLHNFSLDDSEKSFEWSWNVFQSIIHIAEQEQRQAGKSHGQSRTAKIPDKCSPNVTLAKLYNFSIETLLRAGKCEEAVRWARRSSVFYEEERRQRLRRVKSLRLSAYRLGMATWIRLLKCIYLPEVPVTNAAKEMTASLCHRIQVLHSNKSNISKKDGKRYTPERKILAAMLGADKSVRLMRRGFAPESVSRDVESVHLIDPAGSAGVLDLLKAPHQADAPMDVLKAYRKFFEDPFFDDLAAKVLNADQSSALAEAAQQSTFKFRSHCEARGLALRNLAHLCRGSSVDDLARLYTAWLGQAKANMMPSKEYGTAVAATEENENIYESVQDDAYLEQHGNSSRVVWRLPQSHGPHIDHFNIFLQALLLAFCKRHAPYLSTTDARGAQSNFEALDVIVRILMDIDSVTRYKDASPSINTWTMVLHTLASCAGSAGSGPSTSSEQGSADDVAMLTWRLASALGMGPTTQNVPEAAREPVIATDVKGKDPQSAHRLGMSYDDFGGIFSLMSSRAGEAIKGVTLARATPLTYTMLVGGFLKTHNDRPEPLLEAALKVHQWFLDDEEVQTELAAEGTSRRYEQPVQDMEDSLRAAIARREKRLAQGRSD